MENNSDQN